MNQDGNYSSSYRPAYYRLPGNVVALRQWHQLAVPDHQRRRAVLVGGRQTGSHVEFEDRQPDAKLRLRRSRGWSSPHGAGSLLWKLG